VQARQILDPATAIGRRRAARAYAYLASFEIPRDRGFVLFPPGRFPEVREVVDAARETYRNADLEKIKRKKKSFMINILDPSHVTADSPFARFALREDMIAAIAGYLDVVPILTSVNVFLSNSLDGEHESSQLYHCDGDDQSQIKIFVLCSEVGIENGPTVVMSATTSAVLRKKIKYQYRNRVKDNDATALVGATDQHVMTGSPGSVFFLDTSRCFHYGSRVGRDAGSRIVATFQYLRPFSFMLPRDYRPVAPHRHLGSPGLSRLQRLILGLE
jgi:hypothetical protein